MTNVNNSIAITIENVSNVVLCWDGFSVVLVLGVVVRTRKVSSRRFGGNCLSFCVGLVVGCLGVVLVVVEPLVDVSLACAGFGRIVDNKMSSAGCSVGFSVVVGLGFVDVAMVVVVAVVIVGGVGVVLTASDTTTMSAFEKS